MKTNILCLLILCQFSGFAQDTIPSVVIDSVQTHSQFFAISPMSRKIYKVNGLAFGLGHVENKRIANQTINGFNLEVNPAPILGAAVVFVGIMHLPDIIKNNRIPDSLMKKEDYYVIKNRNHTPHLRINGLNVSSGCFFTTTSMNGINISLANKFNDFNGLSIVPLGMIADKQSGLSVGLFNANNVLKGSTIGVLNQSYDLKGVHLGVFNLTRNNHGVQIGVFNRSNSKGLQVGVWNINNKRSMPFINW